MSSTPDDFGPLDPDDPDDVTDEATEGTGREQWRFRNVGEWVEMWFSQVMAGPYVKDESAGGRTWCAQWWRHRMAVERLDKLWHLWEASRLSGDESAMSSWWVYHADAHLRALCDAEYGPMHRCTPDKHRDDHPFRTLPAPDGWFGDIAGAPDPSPPAQPPTP
ncbi:MAG: DUF4913 domain-containing protein [Gordonia polyisoprenivorans]|nr:DUF4913 domain-containing protein [Gordonia polyisoprenivorans]